MCYIVNRNVVIILKIEKYKKLANGQYQIILTNKTINLYEEVILKYELLYKKDISKELLDRIISTNDYWFVYYTALKYLKVKARSKGEVYRYLKSKDLKIEFIEYNIDSLEKQGYINDERYASSFLNLRLLTTSKGPLKIKRELIDKQIDVNIIDKIMLSYTKEIEEEKINKVVAKKIKSNHNKSNTILKQKIINDLLTDGFSKELVLGVVNNLKFSEDSEIRRREYDKIHKKLSRKYKGEELLFNIKQKMYQKGFKDE